MRIEIFPIRIQRVCYQNPMTIKRCYARKQMVGYEIPMHLFLNKSYHSTKDLLSNSNAIKNNPTRTRRICYQNQIQMYQNPSKSNENRKISYQNTKGLLSESNQNRKISYQDTIRIQWKSADPGWRSRGSALGKNNWKLIRSPEGELGPVVCNCEATPPL